MIDTIISRFLAANKRLVVPELGAFIRKDSGELVFVEFLKKDDGVLAGLVASELGLGVDEAREAVAGYVDGVRRAVAGAGRYVIAGVGDLRNDPNGILALGVDFVAPAAPVVPDPSLEVVSKPEPAPAPAPAPAVIVSEPEVKAFTLNDLYNSPSEPAPVSPEPKSFNDLYTAPAAPLPAAEPVVAPSAPRSFNDLYAEPAVQPTALNDLYAKPEPVQPVQPVAPRPHMNIRRPVPNKKRTRTDIIMIIAIAVAILAIGSMIWGMVRQGNPAVRQPIEQPVMDSVPEDSTAIHIN